MSFFQKILGIDSKPPKHKVSYFEFYHEGKLKTGEFELCGVTPNVMCLEMPKSERIIFLKQDKKVFPVKESQIKQGKDHKKVIFHDFVRKFI